MAVRILSDTRIEFIGEAGGPQHIIIELLSHLGSRQSTLEQQVVMGMFMQAGRPPARERTSKKKSRVVILVLFTLSSIDTSHIRTTRTKRERHSAPYPSSMLGGGSVAGLASPTSTTRPFTVP